MVKNVDALVDEILEYFDTEAKNPNYTSTLKRMDLQNILSGNLYDDGYDVGYETGYEKGRDEGYDEGYEEGFDEGNEGSYQ